MSYFANFINKAGAGHVAVGCRKGQGSVKANLISQLDALAHVCEELALH